MRNCGRFLMIRCFIKNKNKKPKQSWCCWKIICFWGWYSKIEKIWKRYSVALTPTTGKRIDIYRLRKGQLELCNEINAPNRRRKNADNPKNEKWIYDARTSSLSRRRTASVPISLAWLIKENFLKQRVMAKVLCVCRVLPVWYGPTVVSPVQMPWILILIRLHDEIVIDLPRVLGASSSRVWRAPNEPSSTPLHTP